MSIPIYQVDAFASSVFKGNPAAVMPLEAWLDDDTLQAIAMENNLSETAYLVKIDGGYDLRWFTPQVEVDLCGHATLATAHVLFEHLHYSESEIVFFTRSGQLRVTRAENGITMDFPVSELRSAATNFAVCEALGATASEVLERPGHAKGPHLYVYGFEEDVARLTPNFAELRAASSANIIVTAPGNDCDFVSRFFAPHVGIDEDPVTGSAHCCLVPYWAERLDQKTLTARQISARGGQLDCELREDRVFMTGKAVTFMEGKVASLAG